MSLYKISDLVQFQQSLTEAQMVIVKHKCKIKFKNGAESYDHREVVRRFFQLIKAQPFQPEAEIKKLGKSRVVMEVGYSDEASDEILTRLQSILHTTKLLDTLSQRMLKERPKGILSKLTHLFHRIFYGSDLTGTHLMVKARRLYLKTIKLAVKELMQCPYWTAEVKKVSRSTLCDFRAVAITAFFEGKSFLKKEAPPKPAPVPTRIPMPAMPKVNLPKPVIPITPKVQAPETPEATIYKTPKTIVKVERDWNPITVRFKADTVKMINSEIPPVRRLRAVTVVQTPKASPIKNKAKSFTEIMTESRVFRSIQLQRDEQEPETPGSDSWLDIND